jgi:hypothetical protein
MSQEEKLKCEREFDEFLRKATEWIDLQKEMLEGRPAEEKVDEIVKLYTEVRRRAKEWASCELKS